VQVRKRVKRRKRLALHRGPAPIPTGRVQRWGMAFVQDALLRVRAFRVLTVIDQWSRGHPSLDVAVSLTGKDAVGAFEAVVAPPQLPPKSITVDQRTEFTSKAVDAWAFYRDVALVSRARVSPPRIATSNPSTDACAKSV
jgi:putative transposase